MAGMTHIVAALPFAGWRGPEPPFFVCSKCGVVSDTPWINPILEFAKKKLGYTGDVTGGCGLCHACEGTVAEAAQAEKQATRFADGVPEEFKGQGLADYQQREENLAALAAAHNFLDASGKHDLFFYGSVGTGKSRLAAALATEGAKAWKCRAVFARTAVLMRRLQESMSSNEPCSMDEWVRPKLLVLDDVGSEKGSDFTRRTLQTLYDMRRDIGNRTVWTSNLDLDALGEFFDDDRLSSRIAGAAEVVYIGGDDQRAAGWRR